MYSYRSVDLTQLSAHNVKKLNLKLYSQSFKNKISCA